MKAFTIKVGDKFEKIISRLKDELENNNKVLGLVLVGSTARENIYKATEYSDIEAYIIVGNQTSEQVEKELEQTVSKLGTVLFSYHNQWAGFSCVFEDLLRLELPIVEESNMQNVFSRPKAQTVKVLIDKTNGKLQNALDKRPEEVNTQTILDQTVKDFWYMTLVGVQYFKKGEYWNAHHVIEVSLIPNIIKIIELNKNPNLLMLESNKRIEEFIPENSETLKKLSVGYEPEKIKAALLNCIEEFEKLINKQPGYAGKLKTKIKQLLLSSD